MTAERSRHEPGVLVDVVTHVSVVVCLDRPPSPVISPVVARSATLDTRAAAAAASTARRSTPGHAR
jgi:hypothetical protein